MNRKMFAAVLSLLVITSMLLTACAPKPTEPATTAVPTEIAPTEETPGTTRHGGWADEIVFTGIPEQPNGIAQLQADAVDVYAVTVDDATLFESVSTDSNLAYSNSYGSFDAFMFNPAGPEFEDGRLNPFSNQKIREAMNWLLDRKYVAEEVVGNGAKPKTVVLISAFPDYALYADIIRPLENKYAYNMERANSAVATEMEAMGAVMGDDGKWQYNGSPVVILGLIRSEDEREDIGNYFADQLEDLGFTVDRMIRTRSEAAPLWQSSPPESGQWSFYTAGWGYGAIVRDMGIFFDSYYNPRGDTTTTQQAYVVGADFDAASLALATNDFATMDERRQLFDVALTKSLEESQVVFAVDLASFTARDANILTAYDLAGGINFSQIWPFTMRWNEQEGGTIRIAQSAAMVSPWNSIAGSNWVDDQMVIRATQDDATLADPYTGLVWPQRMERAEVVVQEGLPVVKTLDWVSLEFADEITVPEDAWIDWDAANQRFITVGESHPEGLTSLAKTTVYYPEDMWTTVKWHDGSPISLGDFILFMIQIFDTSKPESAIYDPAQVPAFEALASYFKGVKIISTNPLVIETYDDLYTTDAELMVTYFAIRWFPTTAFGPISWHAFALGYLGEANGELAFSTDKATANNVPWTGYLTGPSIDILKKYLDQAQAENFIPYAGTLGQYVKADEVAARYANLQAWYEARHHFWIGTGPYYVDSAFPVEGTIVLKQFAEYPDLADKWNRFSAPKIAVADVSGPAQVTIGEEAVFDVYISYQDAPYPQNELTSVAFMVYDSANNLVQSALAEYVEDGHYQAVLSAAVTNKLIAGASKIEFVVSPSVVSIPTFSAREFLVVAP